MLDLFFSPDAIALAEAPPAANDKRETLLAGLRRGGFGGTVYLIDPDPPAPGAAEAAESDGACQQTSDPCRLPRFGAIGKPVDLAILAQPPENLERMARDAVQAGARAIALVAPPTRRRDPEAAEVVARVTAFCQSRNIPLLVASRPGVINVSHHLWAASAPHRPRPGGVSVVCQSRAVASALLEWMASHQVGLAKLASPHRGSALNETELLAHLAHDPDTRVVVCYLEGIRRGSAFIRAAEEASNAKPVIILKGGVTPEGKQASMQQEAAFSIADVAFGAAFERTGALRAENFDQLKDFAIAFADQPLPRGGRTAVIANGGAHGVMALDALEHLGLSVAQPSAATRERLEREIPDLQMRAGLVLLAEQSEPTAFVAARAALVDDPGVDALLLLLGIHALTPAEAIIQALAPCLAAHRAGDPGTQKPLLTTLMGDHAMAWARTLLESAGHPHYPTPDRAAAALAAMVRYVQWRNRPPRAVTHFPVNRARAQRIISRQQRSDRRRIDGLQAREILAAYGFETPIAHLARSRGEALDWAARIGYPVTLKAAPPSPMETGGASWERIDLDGAEAVRDAYDLLALRLQRDFPDEPLGEITVEGRIPPGHPLVIRMERDPIFGPILSFGPSGFFVEVMKDVSFHLAPLTAEEALRMLRETRSFELLRGAVDPEGVAESLQRVSQLATDFPAIACLQINPLIAPSGGAPPVADRATLLLEPPENVHG